METGNNGNDRIRRLLELDRRDLPPDGGERFNRLIFESSPYLLQHAENPVEWYPWGEEAFAAARREDKPVLLSIGYATCHWCHVMAHESFEDPEVAAVINRHFVPVKVDREERPDIDDQYMLVAQIMTGSGGWPLNVVMTPDRQPFFAVTYLPKVSRRGVPGIVEVLGNLATLWRSRRDLVLGNCASVMEGLLLQTARPAAGGGWEGTFAAACGQLERMYDPEQGGFGTAPKFPMPHFISFLVLASRRSGKEGYLRMAAHTLQMMRRGGIFDQVGFGIHRYSVDRQWLVPHFEKMLYDQALVGAASLAVYRATGREEFLATAEEILAFVAGELTSPEGGFHAALDADSEGVEGRYYLWTPTAVRKALGAGESGLFCRLFDVTEQGNFEGENIPHLGYSLDEFAAGEGIDAGELRERLARWRPLLLTARQGRVRPLRDEKVVTAWNGLMIATLAQAYAVTGTPAYREAATRGAEFVTGRLVTPGGRLLRSWHAGCAGPPAFLEDYAALVHGLVELHQATLEERFLAEALRFSGEMLRLFGDPEEGGLFDSGSDAEAVLVRMKNPYDGVTPSGNGLAAVVLARLGRVTGDGRLTAAAEGILTAFAGTASRQPVNHLLFLTARDLLDHFAVEVTLAGRRDDPETELLLRTLNRRFVPGLAVKFSEEPGAGRTRAHVCAAGACRPPVTGAAGLESLLDEITRREEKHGHGG